MKTLGLVLLGLIALGVWSIARDLRPPEPGEGFKQPPGF